MRYKGSILGLITLLILLLASVGFGNRLYQIYDTLFTDFIRLIYDNTLGLLSFASVYLIFGSIIVWVFIKFFKLIVSTKKSNVRSYAFKDAIIGFINFSGWVFFLFYFLWGFNYLRPNLTTALAIKNEAIDSTAIIEEYLAVTHTISDIRLKVSKDSQSIAMKQDWTEMEIEIRHAQLELLKLWGDNPKSNVRVRRLFPSGSLLSFSTAGIYNPFSLEGHIDPGLHSIQYPFTAAHEMAHGYGYTDEGECNFIGFLTCIRAKDDFIKYSGWLGYWRYLHYEVKAINPKLSTEVFRALPLGIKADLQVIYDASNKYPDIMPYLRNLIYDNYLKANGVKSGLRSYSEIVTLSIWYQHSYGAF